MRLSGNDQGLGERAWAASPHQKALRIATFQSRKILKIFSQEIDSSKGCR
jgi:hypothetical protein